MAKTVLLMQREPSKGEATLSKLFDGTEFLCDILEDQVREIPGKPVSDWKIYGRTAIPSGLYQVVLEDSARYGPKTLTLKRVEGFDLIRIHGGNTHVDTKGCLLTGTRHSSNTVILSQIALGKLRAKLVPKLLAGEEVWIDIKPALQEA